MSFCRATALRSFPTWLLGPDRQGLLQAGGLPAPECSPLRLATLVLVPRHQHQDPPRTVLLIHGAGSGPWIFEGWSDAFPLLALHAVDLQEGVQVQRASMSDYADAIVRAARQHPRPLAAVAWSMGGLAALMAAEALGAMCLVVMEPSPPAEIQGWHPSTSTSDFRRIRSRGRLWEVPATH
jgi:pimeloyl-ACP methyl ester carboxylesterase